jgi:hypothetical protein
MGFWSVSSFSYYLLGFFIKYFPGNMYINFAMLGIADICASFNTRITFGKLGIKNTYRVFLLGVLMFTSLFYVFVDLSVSKDLFFMPALIFTMRLFVSSSF